MSIESAINLQFHRQPRWADPRMTIARSGIGAGIDRLGRIVQYPANTLRPRYHPITGVGEGFLPESQRTNLFLRSQELGNAAWTATSCTVASDVAGATALAPDNTNTAESLTATGSGGSIAQAITITAGRGIAISLHAKAFATNFLYIKVTDGTNTVECWFNLSTGATGTNTAGTGTCVFSQKKIEAYLNSWYRCHLDVTTATSTAFTITFGPAASDGAVPANTNSVYAWGAQAEADVAGAPAGTSYIPTTSATVTRAADNIHLPLDASWFNPNEGTILFEFVNRMTPASASGSHVYGGIANTFSDVMYLARVSSTQARLSWASSLGGSGSLDKNYNFTEGQNTKMAFAWADNDIAFTIDGASPGTSSASFTVPTNFARFGLGCAAWSTADNGNKPYACVKVFRYFPRRLANAHLITLTNP